MTVPLLGLALGRRPPQSLVPLLAALCRWCVPATLDPAAGTPAALLATVDEAHHGHDGMPLALWARSAEEVASPAGARAAAVLSDRPDVAGAAGARGVLAPWDSHARGRRLVLPAVRERLRRARGLPAVAVLAQAGDGWHWPGTAEPLDGGLVATAMACASAVAVREPERLLEALAWGAPCATDPGSAGQAGAVAGTHVLVGASHGERLALAGTIAGDPGLAAHLAREGRALVEHRHDADWAALRLVGLLGLRPTLPEGALATARRQLSLLATPPEARITSRFAEATARVAV